ncbi:phage tail sheath C-terminal domain-containing protein [Pseudovibrio brasiliensis]|uniref:Phage tail sheath subtilisin-like domain-containing protein n=1 Tax=Pseudovibrio brasiliensis TaxID=1898042 RepID=A0ABX8AT11_9HYPH|nr:phage tail sheath C-terminal domain-containing protein [Pseudovibrio brasiliensis]QUS57362.1 phage tail sheath subtilisin-like domain-containing protein [Pseudovibrio brasiliensis]
MADVSFHHGVRVFESAENPILIEIAQTSTIALIGTAEGADAETFPLNEPVLLLGDQSKAAKLGDGNLRDGVDAVFKQVGTYVFVIRVAEGADAAATLSNVIGEASALTGIHALKKCQPAHGLIPRLIAIPGFTGSFEDKGLQSINVTNGGAGYTDSTTVTIAGDGTGADAIAMVSEGAITEVVITKAGSGYTNATVTFNGDGNGATATVNIGAVGDPVIAELGGVLDELEAIGLVDGPDSTDQDAVNFKKVNAHPRIYIVDPKAGDWDTDINANRFKPAAPYFCGVQARTDRTHGFWWSLSNKPINGVTAVSRPIAYGPQTDYLNENGIATIINDGEGFKTWGNRLSGGDDLWRFMAVRRTADFINAAILSAYMEFVDKPFSKANLRFMVESGNAFMAKLKAEGAILGGRVWLDMERNTNEAMAGGKITLAVDFEPPAPMEDIRFIAHRNITYYTELLNGVLTTSV